MEPVQLETVGSSIFTFGLCRIFLVVSTPRNSSESKTASHNSSFQLPILNQFKSNYENCTHLKEQKTI